jgi:hypothetical protein
MARKRVRATISDHWHTIGDSSIISGCGIQDGELVVSFMKSGRPTGTYQYETYDKTLCCQMARSGSKGQFFHANISPLSYSRIG